MDKPSTNVTSYTLTYSSDNTAAQEISIEADKESYTIDELEMMSSIHSLW